MSTIHIDVVSAEESIFSGEAKFVSLPGESGELGILPGHIPLITRIQPGPVRIEKADGSDEFVFVRKIYSRTPLFADRRINQGVNRIPNRAWFD